ncbi:MAG TPA: phosphopantetheine-binding protein [Actinomycetota bacterium]|jgi:acyl carrier protein|nr:phosphopantetheine-binding protein [Actinomycetota bacterium]
MERSVIFDKLRSELSEIVEVPEEMIAEDSLLVDLDADSLDILQLTIALRNAFSIEVEDGEVKVLLTELAQFLPDEGLAGGELSDDELAEVRKTLRVGTIVSFVEDRVNAKS